MRNKTQEVVVACARCTNSVSINQTTYDSAGENLICFTCYNKIAKGEQPDRVIQKAEIPKRLNYECLNCGHKFTRSLSFNFTGCCIHCGRKAVIREKLPQVIFKDRKTLLGY